MESFTRYLAEQHIADLRRQARRPVPKRDEPVLRRSRRARR
jgi:hypothetical protein